MALGIRNLVHLWESAWAAGGGRSADTSDLVGFSEADLRKRYADRKFVPSLDLNHVGPELE
ncbi:hypothetical protein GCM10023144_18170 [Pigmentiphaga soli]|uniref:Uncharacterized protein n=1 Tax=Pigmentiphaga soli TaxID=1007095 RepID=A0ABP8GV81_9BURK